MEVKLAKSAGFCWGVKRAIDMALDLRRKTDAPIHTLGPLIHNPQTLDLLQSKGIHEVEAISQIVEQKVAAENAEGYVVVRAHGIPPETRKGLKASSQKMIDATCPDVGLIQGLIRKHVRKGYDIIILGDPKHPEVIGLQGYTEGRGYVVDDIAEVDTLPNLGEVYVVSQSTLDGETWVNITQKIKERFPRAVVKNTICDATTDRQTEILELCQEVDVMIVVGGRNSANTRKLAKLSQRKGVPTHQVETESEIEEGWFRNTSIVGVTAGASTPNWQIMKVVEKLEALRPAQEQSSLATLGTWVEFCLHHHIFLAFGASALTYVSCFLLGLTTGYDRFLAMVLSGLFVYAMHAFHGSRELGSFTFAHLMQLKFYREDRWPVFLASGLAFFLGLVLSYFLGWKIFCFYLGMSLLGFSYRLEIFPTEKFKLFKYPTLHSIPGSRDIFMACAWGVMIVGLPALYLCEMRQLKILDAIQHVQFSLVVAFAFVTILVFVRSLVSDERDMKRDTLVGRETLPMILGPKYTMVLQGVSLTLLAGLLLFLGLGPAKFRVALLLVPAIVLTYVYVHLYHFRIKYRSLMLDLLADSKFLLIGLWTYAVLHW